MSHRGPDEFFIDFRWPRRPQTRGLRLRDVIRGGSGNDHATGNSGTDRVYGQSGDDSLCSEDDDLLVDNVDQIDRCAVIFTDWADQLN